MGVIRKWQMSITFLLFVAVILVATLPAYASAQSASPCTGSWNGTMGPGTGTVNVFLTNHNIQTSSIVAGTFTGDTTHGNWVGKISTNYTVPDLSTKGQVSSAITGTYVMSVSSSGAVTGTSTIPLSGDFTGQIKLTFQGQESQSGELTGTWTGTLTVTQVTYNGMPLGANISAPGSGQFAGSTSSATPEYPNYISVLVVAVLITLGGIASLDHKNKKTNT